MLPNSNIPSSIVPSILFSMKNYLETAMIQDVPEDDPTRALIVKVGKFQDNPLNKNVLVAISHGDFEDPKYMDGRIDREGLQEIGIPQLVVSEVGGGTYWWRRGTINVQTLFVRQRYTEEVAIQYAYQVYSRLLYAIEHIPLDDVDTDQYGESAWPPIKLEAASFYESGGPKQHIWRGKVLFRVLTFRP